MDYILDILIPAIFIGGVILSVLFERHKRLIEAMDNLSEKVISTYKDTSDDTHSSHHPNKQSATSKKAPEPFLSRITHSPSLKDSNKPHKDDAYAKTDGEGEATEAMDDIRRAIIAHEILKRKF